MAPVARRVLAAATIFNSIIFWPCIFVGEYTGRFHYKPEFAYGFAVTVVVPTLVLFADALPKLLEKLPPVLDKLIELRHGKGAP